MKSLAVNLDEACAAARPRGYRSCTHSRPQSIWSKIKTMCPELEVLIIVLYKNLEKANTLEDIVEVNVDKCNDTQKKMMNSIRTKLNKYQGKGEMLVLTLRFMILSN